MKDELGDVLFQVLFHAQIASENTEEDPQSGSQFSLDDVATNLAEKLIRRHPHVFDKSSDASSRKVESIVANWDKIKQEEAQKNGESSLFADELLKFPALLSASKIGKKSNSIGFDWDHIDEVFLKVDEEKQELCEAIEASDQAAIEEELGDLLFSVAQLARHLKIAPEQALRKSNQKFLHRFALIEQGLSTEKKSWNELSRAEKERRWQQAKSRQKNEQTRPKH